MAGLGIRDPEIELAADRKQADPLAHSMGQREPRLGQDLRDDEPRIIPLSQYAIAGSSDARSLSPP